MNDMNTICALITAKTLIRIDFMSEIMPVFWGISRPTQGRREKNSNEQNQPER